MLIEWQSPLHATHWVALLFSSAVEIKFILCEKVMPSHPTLHRPRQQHEQPWCSWTGWGSRHFKFQTTEEGDLMTQPRLEESWHLSNQCCSKTANGSANNARGCSKKFDFKTMKDQCQRIMTSFCTQWVLVLISILYFISVALICYIIRFLCDILKEHTCCIVPYRSSCLIRSAPCIFWWKFKIMTYFSDSWHPILHLIHRKHDLFKPIFLCA